MQFFQQRRKGRIHGVGLQAFSLVEAVIAIGIVSFAMLGVMGLIPVGLSTFRDAMSTTTRSEILSVITSEVLRTDASNLSATNYYFDERGIPVDSPGDQRRVFTASVAAPTDLSAAAAAQRVVIRISSRNQPSLTNTCSVILPKPVDSL